MLAKQTERNISNKEKAIDKCFSRIAELKQQRNEIDTQIAAEEEKLCNEQKLLQTFKQRLGEAKERQVAEGAQSGIPPSQLDSEPGMPTLRPWMQHNYGDLFTQCVHTQWRQPIARPYVDLFANWKTNQDAVNGFAKHAANRLLAEVDSKEALVARQALQCLLELPHKFMRGPAAAAVSKYQNGIECGSAAAFDVNCPVLQSWVRSDVRAFAPVPVRSTRRRMSGPYLLAMDESHEDEPIQVEQYDPQSVFIEARQLLQQHDAEMAECFPLLQLEKKRSYEYVQSAEKYAAAVVQHKDKLRRLPKFSAYIDEVLPDGGGEGNGSKDLEAAVDSGRAKEAKEQ